ncbi:MAG: hypothetical protein OEN01_10975 [Candidatus Krumholzibacteria bacterium]|nr:hypothetical protein [Candidatus Krumholzibacteria bacterium]
MNPFLGMLITLALVAVLLFAIRVVQLKYSLHAEWVRKLVHVGSGLVALSFPWLYRSAWPVVMVCVIAALGLVVLRRSERWGQILGGVKRESGGEFYFPLTVALIFVLSKGDPVLYCIPLMILTFADAAAALVGTYYGLLYYRTAEGRKSTEGSLVFFVVAFFSTHVPLLLFTDIGRADSLLIGLLVGFLCMVIEAIGRRGQDNLLIPLLAFMILKSSVERNVVELALEATVTVALLVFILLLRRRTAFSGSALLGAVLVGYLSWTLGGWLWMLAPLIMFTVNVLLPRRSNGNSKAQHFNVVLYVSGAGLAWLFLARATNRDELIVAFVVAFAAQLAMLSLRRLRVRLPAFHGVTIVGLSAMIGWLSLFIPFVALGAFAGMILSVAFWSLVAVFLGAWLYNRKLMQVMQTPDTPLPWREQGLYGAVVSLVALVPLYLF